MAAWISWKVAGLPDLCFLSVSNETIFAKGSLAAMAMASSLQHHLPSLCIPNVTSPFSSCVSRSNSCSMASVVPGELRTTCGVNRVGILRAAGSEVAPAPVEKKDGPNLPCDTCKSKGWLVCDFCKGQKINVQVRANKFYRRCPSCRAVGVVICPPM